MQPLCTLVIKLQLKFRHVHYVYQWLTSIFTCNLIIYRHFGFHCNCKQGKMGNFSLLSNCVKHEHCSWLTLTDFERLVGKTRDLKVAIFITLACKAGGFLPQRFPTLDPTPPPFHPFFSRLRSCILAIAWGKWPTSCVDIFVPRVFVSSAQARFLITGQRKRRPCYEYAWLDGINYFLSNPRNEQAHGLICVP